SEELDIPCVALRAQRVGLAQNRDANRVLPVRAHRRLRSAQLIYLAEELFDAAANLLALGPQRFHFGAKLGRLLLGGILLLAEAIHELHRLMDPLLEAAQRISFLVDH